MHGPSRSLAKPERQRLIASLVSRKTIGTQHELLDALADAGCRVTQATVSRDIRDLRLEKGRDSLGRPRYVSKTARGSEDARKTLAGVLARFAHRAVAAQNIVVVHSELGSAPAIGRALDELAHPRIVGTLAGDDTCLVVAKDASDARSLARELSASLG